MFGLVEGKEAGPAEIMAAVRLDSELDLTKANWTLLVPVFRAGVAFPEKRNVAILILDKVPFFETIVLTHLRCPYLHSSQLHRCCYHRSNSCTGKRR